MGPTIYKCYEIYGIVERRIPSSCLQETREFIFNYFQLFKQQFFSL